LGTQTSLTKLSFLRILKRVSLMRQWRPQLKIVMLEELLGQITEL